MNRSSSDELLTAWGNGDVAAGDVFLSRHKDILISVCRRLRTSDRDDNDDARSAALEGLATVAPQFDARVGTSHAFARHYMKTAVLKWMSRNVGRHNDEMKLHDETRRSSVVDEIDQAIVNADVFGLPTRESTAIRLRLRGMTWKDVGDALDVSARTARSYAMAGVGRLRRAWRQCT